ncbi:uncharacterized protein PGTG_04360 [Puccinia graminis f. sp. tritici CRL 75-36-700-3]|uniref:UmuC domain-containing protein n=1 Tax=Puccinia graminis f. sp. tritici (strain CRL 75-36-700-3 / race SCCL) TaxID=418459 RepID=E3K235_PUCGT|nr:uncharacterized protein PGTG_04360 [Puccinia graminis f. sp. tritici CRL 75-36-700-3]EFP78404.2 hypothetical protein PGTG_04360 [Puccinia graminis f. sp. tritici CRL 75-36-700-3]
MAHPQRPRETLSAAESVHSHRLGETLLADESVHSHWPRETLLAAKVSLDPYRRESVKILKIFSEICPTIEKASIDEAFLDFSIPDSSSEISLDDPLPNPPPLDLEDLLRSSQSNLVPLDADSDYPTNTCTDIALLIGTELMARCRQQVFDRLGYTCSAGIATNKMLAKLCSAYKKPNAQTVLRAGAVRDFLRPFELSKLRFLGGKLGQSVSELVDSTCDKLCQLSKVWKVPLSQLQASLGEQTGMWVWESVHDVNRSEVETKTLVKSMMSSKNLRPSISSRPMKVYTLISRERFPWPMRVYTLISQECSSRCFSRPMRVYTLISQECFSRPMRVYTLSGQECFSQPLRVCHQRPGGILPAVAGYFW